MYKQKLIIEGTSRLKDLISVKKITLTYSTIAIVSSVVCALVMLYFFIDARYSNFFPKCPFFALTGWLCPGCGAQRAFSALLHGNIVSAFRYNSMFLVSLFAALYLGSIGVFKVSSTGKPAPKTLHCSLLIKTFFVGILLFGILRNMPFYPFILLTP